MDSIFPDEIFAIILSYLPVISLLRFKCVCRSWLALINSHEFINDHMSKSLSCNSNRMLIVAASNNNNFYSLDFDTPNSPCVTLPLPQAFEGRSLEIGGSCNGVFCLYSLHSDSIIILMNPSTKMYKVIPVKGSTNYIGLGFDFIHDDYKLVRTYCESEFIRPNNYRVTTSTMVYSVTNDSWTTCINSSCVTKILDCEPCGVLVKSHLLHWVLLDTRSVIRFNVCEEKWSEMLLPQYNEGHGEITPPHYSDPFYSLKLGNLDGCLCFYTKRFDDVNIWIMKEYGVVSSWVKIANLSDSNITRHLMDPPFAFSKQGGQILLVNAHPYGLSPRFFWYNLQNNTINNVATHGISSYEGALLCCNTLTRLIGGVQMVD